MEPVIRKAPYLPDWKSHFKSINLDWLERFFSVTPADMEQLSNPERILEKGGMILFVESGNQTVGTLALVPDEDGNWELAKMGVLPAFQGKGLGRMLINAAIDEAILYCKGTLYLETVQILTPAIHLYESIGFERVGEPHTHPAFGRTVFRMQFPLHRRGR